MNQEMTCRSALGALFVLAAVAGAAAAVAPRRLQQDNCPAYIDTKKYRTTNFTDFLNTTVAISSKRPSANVPTGEWIHGRCAAAAAVHKLSAFASMATPLMEQWF
jgi:hypothetical protein